MGLDSRSRPSVLWMKSIPVRVEGPALTSGQSPTYYEYNNGLTGIIEHLRSSRSIALLYPLCWFMTPCDGEEDSSGTRVPCATQWGKKSESLPFSFFPPCVARSPTSPRRAIGSRAIDFVLASAGARREGSTFFSTSETSMPTVDRESLSRARETRLYLGTREPLEPSPLSSPFASVTGRERKRASTIHQEHFDARWKRSDFPLVRILYRRDRRGSFDMCVWKFNSIDPRVNPNDYRNYGIKLNLSWPNRCTISN